MIDTTYILYIIHIFIKIVIKYSLFFEYHYYPAPINTAARKMPKITVIRFEAWRYKEAAVSLMEILLFI